MKKHFSKKLSIISSLIAICLLISMFFLSRRSFKTLQASNDKITSTAKIIEGYQLLSNDYKSAILYTPSLQNSAAKTYYTVYEKVGKKIISDLAYIKSIESLKCHARIDTLSGLLISQFTWLLGANRSDLSSPGYRDWNVKNVIQIQNFIDNEVVRLEKVSQLAIESSAAALTSIYKWIILLFITSVSLVILSVVYIFKQLSQLKAQNKSLMEIAWIQSHKVRSQVATILGLTELFNLVDVTASDNVFILNGLKDSTRKLDEIVKEINARTTV